MTRPLLAILILAGLAGCEKRSGDAVVISKEYIAAAASPAESPTPNGKVENEITVDSYAMAAEDRGTARDPRAMQHEQWLVKVRVIDNGRTFNVPADRSRFERVKPDDRVRVRYHVGKYTGTMGSGVDCRVRSNGRSSFENVECVLKERMLKAVAFPRSRAR